MVTIKVKPAKKPEKKFKFKGKVPPNIDPAVGLHEEKRDSIRKFLKEQATKEHKPSQPSIAGKTSEELKKMRWSGYRVNEILDSLELWVLGEVKGSVSYNNGNPDGNRLATLHEEVFATVGTLIKVDGDHHA